MLNQLLTISENWPIDNKKLFIEKINNFKLAVQINPEIFNEGMESILKEFPELDIVL